MLCDVVEELIMQLDAATVGSAAVPSSNRVRDEDSVSSAGESDDVLLEVSAAS